MDELEAKFLTDDGGSPTDVLRRLQKSLVGAGYRLEPHGRSTFTDQYFDTADHRLRAAGWSYREREDAHGRRAALKEITRSRSAIFDREAIEQDLGPGESLGSLRPGAVRERLSNLLHPQARVTPLFRIRSERNAYALQHPAHPRGLVEMAFDQARIEAEEPVEFHELALELKSGPPELLADVLIAVEREPTLIEARVSRFERGLLAAGGSLERRRGLTPKPLDRRARWLDLALVHLQAELQRIRLYEPHAWEGVCSAGASELCGALRRAHGAVRTFAAVLRAEDADRVANGLRWLRGIAQRVDDLTAQLTNIGAYARGEAPTHRATLDRYRRHLRHLHHAAERELRGALSTSDYTSLISGYQRLLTDAAQPGHHANEHIDEMAGPALLPLLERVRGRRGTFGVCAGRAALRGLHADVLRLLDRIEFLEQAYAAELAAMLAPLRELGARLDALRQASDARALLQRYRDVHLTREPPRALINHLMRLEGRRAARQRQRLDDAWKRFDRAAAELIERFA